MFKKIKARLAGKDPIIIDRKFEDGWKLQAKALEETLAAKKVQPKSMLIFTNPDNPSKI